MGNLKKYLIAVIVILFGYQQVKACHGLPLVNYNVTVGATGVAINANSGAATCGCGPYWLQTQISCSPWFPGNQPACMISVLTNWNNPATSYLNYPYYNSLLNVPNYNAANGWPENCVVEPYHTNIIPFANLCPGKTYYIRSREIIMGNGGSNGQWTAAQSFVVPGNPIVYPPNSLNMTLVPSTNQIVCCGPVQLTAITTGTNWPECRGNIPSCEINVTVTPTYSWSASNPVSTTIGTGTTFTTATNILSVTNLTTTTTFSVWLTYVCTSPTGTTIYTPPFMPIINTSSVPLTAANITNTFLTAAANSVWTQALLVCPTAITSFFSTQPAITTVNVLNVAPPLNVTISPNTCINSPNFTFTDISANAGNYNLSWNFGDGGVGVGASVIHTYSNPGIYNVTVIKSGCGACSAVGNYTVEVYPTPSPILSINSPVCIGGTASFINPINNGISFNWSGPNNFGSTQQNPTLINVAGVMGGVYTCITKDANGCIGTSVINLATYQEVVTIAANNPVCSGSMLNLTASGNGNYSWTGPNNFTSTQQNPSLIVANNTGGNYIVTATLTGHCYASDTINIIVNVTNLTASNNGPGCFGSNIQLNAIGNGSFLWQGPNGFTSTLQNPLLNSVTSLESGDYTVTITSAQGCTQTAITNVVVQAPKTLSPKSTGTICEGGTVYLETLDAAGLSYLWNGPNGFIANTANVNLVDATPASSGVYTITMKDAFSCVSKGQINVLVNPKPTADIDMSNAKSGCAPVCNVSFNALSTSGILDYTWDLANGSANHTNSPNNLCYNVAGSYSIVLTVKDANGCSSKITKTLDVYPTPVSNFSNNNATFTNPQMQFTDLTSNGNITNWYWTFGAGTDASSTQQNPNFTYQDTGKYFVVLNVKTDKGCENKFSKYVYVADELGMFIPNAFTPNGDDQNDVFTAVANNVSKFEMLIFNRGGNLIFQSSDIKKGWDGTYKGQLVDDNVYVYKVTFIGKAGKSQNLNGTVTLIK